MNESKTKKTAASSKADCSPRAMQIMLKLGRERAEKDNDPVLNALMDQIENNLKNPKV
jgi:hypothetical protein